MGSLLECFLRAVTGAGPVVATAGPAQATALIKQSKIVFHRRFTANRSKIFSETDKIRTANLSSVNLHRIPNSVFWWLSITLHRTPN